MVNIVDSERVLIRVGRFNKSILEIWLKISSERGDPAFGFNVILFTFGFEIEVY